MEEIVNAFSGFGAWWWILPLLLLLVFWKQVLWLFGILVIPEDSIGIVNLKFNLLGKNKTLPDGKIIALNGESGWQADTLAPGLQIGYWPWQYQVLVQEFVNIPQGKVGVIESRDGSPIPIGRVLGKAVECDKFQSARNFLVNGGERGPQIGVMPPGTYRINTMLFTIEMQNTLEIPQGKVGIVTTLEGAPLRTGEIAGKEIDGHNMFQDGQKFVEGGGFKGLQEQVMLAGTYYRNPRFMNVEMVDMTSVPIGNVGVVVAYVGERVAEGDDVSGDKQIRLVRQGQKGVWDTPLDPGKYPINPYTHKVENVPTTNIVLNWAEAKTEAHELDANLSTIKVRSSDGFTFNLDVSQIIHIARSNAPKVIARFGNMANLVTQVLEPLIGNYFRNSAQTSDVIGFLSARAERQAQAKTHISEAVSNYNVQAVDTLIGDITPPEELMKTLTDRKVAEQQKTTYTTQKEAEETRADLANARALADTKPQVVDSLRQVEIKTNLANARVEEAKGEAGYKKAIADADAHVLMVTGKAQGENTLAVGGAEADVLRKKVGAVGQHGYVSMQIADFLATNRIQLVPNFLVQGGGADGKSGSIADAFVAFMLAKQAEVQSASTPSTTETAAPAATA